MLVLILEIASEKFLGKLMERMLKMSFHGRRAPSPPLIHYWAPDMYSKLTEVPHEPEEVGIVSYSFWV